MSNEYGEGNCNDVFSMTFGLACIHSVEKIEERQKYEAEIQKLKAENEKLKVAWEWSSGVIESEYGDCPSIDKIHSDYLKEQGKK